MGSGGVEDDGRGIAAYLVFGGLVLLMLVMVAIVVTTLGAGGKRAVATPAERAEKLRDLPVYWTVRRGDTYVGIADKTGLTVNELESFNPYVDPSAIQPGQRLKLRLKVPKPKPKPLGPKYATVRTGDSFGSIAAKTGKDITRLQRLNPKLKPTELRPGDRMRLR
jgi:LysM repeat protein